MEGLHIFRLPRGAVAILPTRTLDRVEFYERDGDAEERRCQLFLGQGPVGVALRTGTKESEFL